MTQMRDMISGFVCGTTSDDSVDRGWGLNPLFSAEPPPLRVSSVTNDEDSEIEPETETSDQPVTWGMGRAELLGTVWTYTPPQRNANGH